jgi:methyl-accepting chemotaxis protein
MLSAATFLQRARAMTISRVTKWLGTIVLAGYLMTLVTSHYALDTLKVGGEHHNRIVLGKDLIADILPPPFYLIESYLEATLALVAHRDADGNAAAREAIAGHVQNLKALEKDYRTRYAFWIEQTLPADLKEALLTASYEPGSRFWRILNENFVPALSKDDGAEARRFYADLAAAYKQHRAGVDRAVRLANAENERVTAEAARQETITVSLMWAVGLAVLLMVIGGVVGVLVAILAPINRLNGAMRTLTAGSNDIVIPYADRKDEIGEMAQSVEVFRANAVERQQLEGAMARTRAMEVARQENLDKHLLVFKEAISTNLKVLVDEVGALRETADTLLDKASEASRQARSSATACYTAASGSQAVAAATEELNSSIREIAAQANSTSTIVGQTTDMAQRTDAEVTNLMDAVAKIETVVTLIRQIAQHTNLLALNATIESARAGEAGKGFAVVATEVKGLSEQTAKATEEIAQQIHTVQSTTNAAAEAVRAIGNQVADIHHLASSVAAAVEEQQAATADIARNVNVVATGTNAAAENSKFVTEVAEHTGAEARRLAAASSQLQAVSSAVSKAVQDFIDAVTSDVNERRAASRHAVNKVLVIGRGGRQHHLRAFDVSETGIRIASIPEARQGEIVEVRFGTRSVRARVVWLDAEACGLQFAERVSRSLLAEAGLLVTEDRHRAA